MSEYVVELKHITKRFPGVVALKDMSIGIRPGEIHGLIGENGAGKSTTMNIITIMKTMTTTMSTIMNMTKTAPADAMTMSIIITIMQMKCLQAGAKRRLTNSRRKRSRMY